MDQYHAWQDSADWSKVEDRVIFGAMAVTGVPSGIALGLQAGLGPGLFAGALIGIAGGALGAVVYDLIEPHNANASRLSS